MGILFRRIGVLIGETILTTVLSLVLQRIIMRMLEQQDREKQAASTSESGTSS